MQYIKITAVDAVLNGTEYTLPDTYVGLRDSTTGYDGAGSYHIQLAVGFGTGGGGSVGYKVTYGTPLGDTSSAMTILHVMLTPNNELVFSDDRKLNVGAQGVNATVMQTANVDGSYLADGVVTQRTLASGISLPVAHGTSFPGSPFAYELFYRDDLAALFVYNGSAWENADSLAALNDVAISTPISGQVLTYDAATSKWINAASGGGGGVTSLNSLTGALGITSPDGSISIATAGSDVTLSARPVLPVVNGDVPPTLVYIDDGSLVYAFL